MHHENIPLVTSRSDYIDVIFTFYKNHAASIAKFGNAAQASAFKNINMNESVWDLKQTLVHERRALKALEHSNQRWEEINADLQKDITNVTTTGNEWKIR